MTLLISKISQSRYYNYEAHLLDFYLLNYLLPSDSKCNDTFYSAITPYNIIQNI